MQVSASWLKQYAKTDAPVGKIAERLTMGVNEVDEIRSLDGLRDIVVAEVAKLERHPDADTLWVATVRTSRQTYTIVTGADNLAVGEKVPLAKSGVTLPDGLKIAKRKLRGVLSEGMLCSPRELGAGEDHSGIWLLPADAPVGQPLPAALGGQADSFELDVPANRPDLMGHLGIAREAAALLGARLAEPSADGAPKRPKRGKGYEVKIQDPSRCARFTLARIRGVKIGESPDWLKNRLISVGLRPINAIVDVTNFVMLEYGQPLHAYDAEKLTGVMVYARSSRPDETLKTLDGKDRKLPKDTLVIADRTQVLGIAGIMGGTSSEVTRRTGDILLECANFDGATVRRASRQLGLRTDASARFEKNLPAELAWPAIRRAISLIVETCGGETVQLVDSYPRKQPKPMLKLDLGRLESQLGKAIPAAQARMALQRLGFAVTASKKSLTVKPPYWRPDVRTDADVVEEVARSIGYDQLPSALPVAQLAVPTRPPLAGLKCRLSETLASGGYTEVLTHSLVGSDLLKRAGYPTEGLVAMENPLSADHEFLRRSMEPRHLESVADNLRWRDGLRLFEVGRTFKRPKPTGPVTERTWLMVTVAAKRKSDIFAEARGALTVLAESLKVSPTSFGFTATELPQYAAGRQFDITYQRAVVGHVAEYGAPDRWKAAAVAFLSLELDRIIAVAPEQWKVSALSEFPVVRRDLSIFVPNKATYAEVRTAVADAAGPLLRSVGDPEEFRKGRQRSLTVKLSFGAADRTLTDSEVAGAMAAVEAAATKQGWKVRE